MNSASSLVASLTSARPSVTPNAALEIKDSNGEARNELLLIKVDLLSSLVRFAEARTLLSTIRPTSGARQKKIWLRQIEDPETEEQRSAALESLLADTQGLSNSNLNFIKAFQSSNRSEKIEQLKQTLAEDPKHRAARQELLAALLLEGETSDVYEFCSLGRQLFPDDLFFPIASAIAAAYAGDADEYQHSREFLNERLGDSDSAILSSVVEECQRFSEMSIGWDTGRGIDMAFLQDFGRFASFSLSLEGASPVLKESVDRLTMGTGSAQTDRGAVSALAAAAPRIAIAIAGVAFGNTKPFASLMSDAENASPIKGDAFFSFVRAIPGIAGDDTSMAQQELEECILRPSIIPYFRTEAHYALAMVYKMRLLETKDPAFMGKSVDAFRKWLQLGPQLHRDRLNYAVIICLQGGDTTLAMKFVELAEQKIPDQKALILQSRLKILMAEKHFSGVIEKVDRTLKEETADEALQKSLAESRNEAIRKLGELNSLHNGVNESAPVDPDAQSDPK